jgi:hypothetical protein
MRAANILVFDEYMTSASTIASSSDALNATLGAFDQIALMVVVDAISSGDAGFKVKIWHSADGRHWLAKNGDASIAEIGGSSGLTLVSPGPSVYAGGDPGTKPNLGLVNIEVTLGMTSSAHVRVYVTGRNLGAS